MGMLFRQQSELCCRIRWVDGRDDRGRGVPTVLGLVELLG